MRIKNNTTPVCEMQAQLRFKGCPGTLITSLKKLSRQADFASFCARSEGVNEFRGQNVGGTEVKNGSPDKKRAP
jgi:hypothetical protein